MAVISANQETFEKLNREGKKLLVDFSARWCGPCKMIAPVLEEISEERSDWTFLTVDVDEETELAVRFGVVSIPMLVALKDGAATGTLVGLRGKAEILSLLD